MPGTSAIALIDREKSFVPVGETEELKLTVAMVKAYLAKPTKSGKVATDSDCLKFVMLCYARKLNPWVGDAFLVGYDTKQGDSWVAEFNLITAVQALEKRAEMHMDFRGVESGVIVRLEEKGSKYEYLDGEFVPEGYLLVGGWARSHREKRVAQYNALNLGTFNTGLSRWNKDPAGMIVKCARASVLRKQFPTQCSGMYVEGEYDRKDTITGTVVNSQTLPGRASPLNAALNAPKKADEKFEVKQPERETVPVNNEVQKQTPVNEQQATDEPPPNNDVGEDTPEASAAYLKTFKDILGNCETQGDAKFVFDQQIHPDCPLEDDDFAAAEAHYKEVSSKLPLRAKKKKELFEKGNEDASNS